MKYKPIEWPQKKTCIRCDADFLVVQGGNVAQKYCGSTCQLAAKEDKRRAEVEARREAKRCEHCGSPFMADKFAGHKQRFCSDGCRSLSRNIARYANGTDGAKRRNEYKYDFKRIKPLALERDGNKCVICGSPANIHVHHWDNSGGNDHVNNTLENLSVLCGVCHYAIHGITLAKIDGKWVLDSKIFKLLGLTGEIPIK
ncbi:MAG: hypothetical protein ACXWJZ_01455 [Burkholderiaceae bacterium]